MGRFSSSTKESPAPPPSRGGNREAGLSVIAAGTRVEGTFDTDGVLKIEGSVVGQLRAEKQILVARGGTVEGDLHTGEAVVGGHVTGAIYADVRVEVQANATVQGDIATPQIVVQEGGEVNGRLQMGPANAARSAVTPALEEAPNEAALTPAGAPTSRS